MGEWSLCQAGVQLYRTSTGIMIISRGRFAEAAGKGVKRAIMAGSKHPLVMVQGTMPGKGVKECELAGLLGALAAVYVPLEMREVGEEEATKAEGMGWVAGKERMEEDLARDISGSDPFEDGCILV